MEQSLQFRPQRFVFDGYSRDDEAGRLVFRYRFEDGPAFTEELSFGRSLPDLGSADRAALQRATAMLYALSGISYYKLFASQIADLRGLPLGTDGLDLLAHVYAAGLGEFAYRNDLDLSDRPRFENAAAMPPRDVESGAALDEEAIAVLIGGGKDSLVSLEAMRASGAQFALFAVNPRKPMLDCAQIAGKELLSVTRILDPALFEWNKHPLAYNGHVPITAIVSMIAVVGAFFHGYGNIVLSNERSADEATLVAGGQEINHQYSKSSEFEQRIAQYLSRHVSPELHYFSLLRPLTEVHIAQLFGRTDAYDHAFTSCNRAFRLQDRPEALWCRDCAKCRFTFLLMALSMERERVLGIFGADLLDDPAQEQGFRDLCGLGRHKPWDCVGEERESAAALATLAKRPEWRDTAVLRALADELGSAPGFPEAAMEDLLTPLAAGTMPPRFRAILDEYVAR